MLIRWKYYFLTILLIKIELISFCQKYNKCEVLQNTFYTDSTTFNKLLSISFQFDTSYKAVPDYKSYEIIYRTNLNEVLSEYDDIKAVDEKSMKRIAVVFHLLDLDTNNNSRQIYLSIRKNVIMSFREIEYLEPFVSNLSKVGIYKIHYTDNSPLYKYQDSNGLWWYYVKYSLTSDPPHISYLVVKNYNNHTAMFFHFNNLGINEKIENYIENIKIKNWNDSFKLEKSKDSCNE